MNLPLVLPLDKNWENILALPPDVKDENELLQQFGGVVGEHVGCNGFVVVLAAGCNQNAAQDSCLACSTCSFKTLIPQGVRDYKSLVRYLHTQAGIPSP